MGFGMRKEDYQRKPKEAFSKVKKYNNLYAPTKKNQLKEGHEGVDIEKHIWYKKHKHFYETKLFKVFFLGIFIFLCIFIIFVLMVRGFI